MEVTRQFRGISERLAVQYLESLGGQRVEDADPDGADDEDVAVAEGDGERAEGADRSDGDDERADAVRVEGDGWTAEVSAETVDAAGSISLTEVTVRFEGDSEALEPVVEAFARKAIRAGG